MDDSKVAVLLEDLKAQFQVFGEGLQTVIQKTDRLEQRFDGLEKRFDGLEQRFDGLEQRFDGLERRFGRLEQRVDRIEQKLDTHIEQNHQEHTLMMQMIQDLNHEVQVKLKRVK